LDLALVGKRREDLVQINLIFESNINSPASNRVLQVIEDWPLAIIFDCATQISINTALKMQVSLKDSVVNRRAYNEAFKDMGGEFERHVGQFLCEKECVSE
jgi:hypothetical protein